MFSQLNLPCLIPSELQQIVTKHTSIRYIVGKPVLVQHAHRAAREMLSNHRYGRLSKGAVDVGINVIPM